MGFLKRFSFSRVERHHSLYLRYYPVRSMLIHSKSENSMLKDYPFDIPFVNRQTRPPYDPNYFDITERRQFGEPVLT
ncbi:hypothetical protein PCK2_000170 [Pneumocystis canis]|nr:hypothetical protein PCK2_000170 [Pneumocystis canis]